MELTIFDVEQGSEAWHECRRGVPTTSNFKSILAKSAEMAMRHRYCRRLAAERWSGQVLESFSTPRMADGHRQEDLIRTAYAFLTGTTPQKVGFVRRGIAGCSPDSFVGDDGLLEIKSADPHILMEIIERDTFPGEHKAQCQGGLWVCKRQWVDIAIGCFPEVPPARPYPLFVKRAVRDDLYIATLNSEVEKFDREVGALVETVSNYVPD